MFHRRSTEFDPRMSAIAGHLRAIEKELGALGKSGGQRAAASASVVGNQIADAIGPILGEIVDRFLRGQSSALKDAATLGNQAIRSGAGWARMLCSGLPLTPNTAPWPYSQSP